MIKLDPDYNIEGANFLMFVAMGSIKLRLVESAIECVFGESM